MTHEDFLKYDRNMSEIYRRDKEETLVSVDGVRVDRVTELFGHCNENQDIVYDIEFWTFGNYYNHLFNVTDNRLKFQKKENKL